MNKVKYKYKVGDVVQIIGEQRPGQAEIGFVGLYGQIIKLHTILNHSLFIFHPSYQLEIRCPSEIINDEIFGEECLYAPSKGAAFIYLVKGNETDLNNV